MPRRQRGAGVLLAGTVAGDVVRSAVDPITTVLWSTGHENGSLSDWYAPSTSADGNEGGDPLQLSGAAAATAVSSTVARTGTYSLRHSRTSVGTDLAGSRAFRWIQFRANRELWIDCWCYIPQLYTLTGDPNTGQFWNAFQFKAKNQDGTRVDVFWQMEFRNLAAGVLRPIMVWGAGGNATAGPFSTSNVSFKSWTTKYINGDTTGTPPNLPIAQWFRLRSFIKQSKDFDGRVVMWLNDEKLYDFQNVRTAMPSTVHGNSWSVDQSWSVNLYNDGLDVSPAYLYVDDARIGTGTAPA